MYLGDEVFQDCIAEAAMVETMDQLQDDAVCSQRLKLQLGHIGAYEAYGIDPAQKKPTVLKVFSPPRLTAYGSKKGLIGGVALDLTAVDEDGVAWDFSKAERRARLCSW